MATDYRDEALQSAFPNIKKSGLMVRSQVQSEPWVVDAKDLEKLLERDQDPTLKYWVMAQFITLMLAAILLYRR